VVCVVQFPVDCAGEINYSFKGWTDAGGDHDVSPVLLLK